MTTAEQYKAAGERAAQRQAALQDVIENLESGLSSEGAMQAGARPYPEPPVARQHLEKPGNEHNLDVEPMYDAPFYKGSEKLAGKVALITGGDSGIGRSVALLFAREGADVAIVYLNEHEDARKTGTLVEKEGRKCLLIPGDVTDPDCCRYVVSETIRILGGLDVLVNNAAFQLHVPDLPALSEDHFDCTVKTNLYGYFHMVQAAVEHMKPGSAIINTGSVTGLTGHKDLPDYSLTKGGIHAFTRALGTLLIPKDIRVNAVAPGPVWTPLNPSDSSAEEIADFGKTSPMGRPAQPEEIAPAYVFLASSHCSSYITGEVLPVIGGYISR